LRRRAVKLVRATVSLSLFLNRLYSPQQHILGAFAKLKKVTIRFMPALPFIRPHGIRIPLDEFL